MRSCSWLVAGLVGCGTGGRAGDTDDLVPFACELGALDPTGAFVPFDEHAEAELVLGFQGLLMLQTRVWSDEPPGRCTATGAVTPVGEGPTGTNQPQLAFDATGLSTELVLFLPSQVPSAYTGREAELAVRLEGGGHRCVTTATVTLVDHDDCLPDDPGCAP